MTRHRDADGTVRPIERHGKTKGKAKQRLDKALLERKHFGPGDGEITSETPVTDLAEAYWKWFCKLDRSPNTHSSYRPRIDNQIIPGLGRLRIREATTPILDLFIDGVETEKGPSTAKVTRTVLSGMLAFAVRRGAITVNPIREVANITVKHKTPTALKFAQAQDLHSKVHANKRAVSRDLPDLIDMLLVTGVRIGEALAMVWDCFVPAEPAECDCPADECAVPDKHQPEACNCRPSVCPDPDLHERCAVEIRGTVVRIKGQGLIIKPEPKSKAGFRTVVLTAWYTAQLRARKPADALPTDPAFPRVRAERDPDDPANVATLLRDPSNTASHLRDAYDDAGYPDITSHIQGRKTLATELKRSGKDDRDTADQLGHANIAVTQKHYFARERVVSHGADVMERLLPPRLSEPDNTTDQPENTNTDAP